MPIGPVTMIGIYLVCWWTVLFAVLPLGMNQQDQERPTDGAQWGAPKDPQLKRKFITTTWVAAIPWLIIMLMFWTRWLPLPNLG
jgi:predicted secreted protein